MLQITENTADYTVSVSSTDAIILIWKNAATVAGVQATERAEQLLRSLRPSGTTLVLFTITFPSIAIPDPEALTYIGDYLKRSEGVYRASAVLHLDTGWRAKVVAAMTWALAKAADYPFPHRPFVSLSKAVRWLQSDWEIDGTTLVSDVKELVAAVEELDV